jgi:sulfur-oxidizing protein SoxX
MKDSASTITALVAGALITGSLSIAHAEGAADKPRTPLEQGKDLAISMCQACHQFEGTDQAGTLGPPIVAMKDRFPEKKRLYDIIYDPHVAIKPHSMMPPFGRNGLLDDNEIQLVIDYIYTL